MLKKLFHRKTGFVLLLLLYAGVLMFSFFYVPPLKIRSYTVSAHFAAPGGIWLEMSAGSLEGLQKGDEYNIELLNEVTPVRATDSTGKVFLLEKEGGRLSGYSRTRFGSVGYWSFYSPETLKDDIEWLDLEGELVISRHKILPAPPVVALTSEAPATANGFLVKRDSVRKVFLATDGTRTDVPSDQINPPEHFYEITIAVLSEEKETFNLTLLDGSLNLIKDYEEIQFSAEELKKRNSLFKKESHEISDQGTVYTKKIILQHLPEVLRVKIERRGVEEKITLPFKERVKAGDFRRIK